MACGRGGHGVAADVEEEAGRGSSRGRGGGRAAQPADASKMHTGTLHYNCYIPIIFASYKGYLLLFNDF